MSISFQPSRDFQGDSRSIVLPSKVSIPPLARNDIIRQRLIHKLDEGDRFKLTLVTAPAGSGKTTLVRFTHNLSKRFGFLWNQRMVISAASGAILPQQSSRNSLGFIGK